MELLHSLPVASPSEALRFICTSSASCSSLATDRDAVAVVENSLNAAQPAVSGTSSLPKLMAALPDFPGLKKLLCAECAHEKRWARAEEDASAMSHAPLAGLFAEDQVALSHVATKLVNDVIERAVSARRTPVKHYKEALLKYISRTPLVVSLASENDASKHTSSESSDDSILSQSPHSSMRTFEDDFVSFHPSGQGRHLDEQHALMHRYELCCEMFGILPVSNLLDRIASEKVFCSPTNSQCNFVFLSSNRLTSSSSASLTHQHPKTSRKSVLSISPVDEACGTYSSDAMGDERPKIGVDPLYLEKDSQPSCQREIDLSIDVISTLHLSPSVSALPHKISGSGAGSDRETAKSANQVKPINAIGPPSRSSLLGVSGTDDKSSLLPLRIALPVQSASDGSALESHILNFADCEGIGQAENLIPLLGLLEGCPQTWALILTNIGLDNAGVHVLVLLCEAHLSNLCYLDISQNLSISDKCGPSLQYLLERQRTLQYVGVHATSMSRIWINTINILSRRNFQEKMSMLH